jgi:hypothetical protein
MTGWEHAIVSKRIINHDNGGQPVMCCWGPCEGKRATLLYRTIQHEHPRGISCEAVERGELPGARHYHYTFCSERHKAYWDNATGTNALESIERTGRAYGNLPAGMRARR